MATRKLTIYYYPRCGTCRQAVKWLSERGYELDLRDLWERSPSVEELRAWMPLSGLPVQKWFNVSGDVYRELGLKDKLPGMSDDDKIALLADNGKLVKRPVVTDGKRVTVGFNEASFEANWS